MKNPGVVAVMGWNPKGTVMSMREKMLVAISAVHSGNREEAERIVDAALDTLMEPTAGMVEAAYNVPGVTTFAPGQIPAGPITIYQAMIRAAKEGK